MDEHAETPEALTEAAEEVRAFLVAVRGGAPFLSGADARLLVDWLEAGIPVSAILTAIEAAATRRARKPTRTRLTLSACQGELKRRLTRRAAPSLSAPEPTDGARSWPALGALAEEIARAPMLVALEEARVRLLRSLNLLATGRSVDGEPLDDPSGEQVARQAIAACRVFQDAAWQAAAPERAELLAEAASTLSSLKDIISEEALAAATEEVARDRLRARTPLVSAQVVWDRITGSG